MARWRRRLAQFTAGGRWTDRMPALVRRNLRWFWLDGVFFQATDAIALAYLSLFVLALGASGAQIGWMSALSSLSAAVLLLPGAALAQRPGGRKRLCLTGGAAARLMLLLLALTPIFVAQPAVIYVAIALVVAREAFANLTLPAWVSLTADIVPFAWRGRYFSSRNIAMSLAGMATTLLVGYVITHTGSPEGYQIALVMAFVLSLFSLFYFAKLKEPARAQAVVLPAVSPLRHLRANRAFIALCAATAVWNFALNTAGPFFNLYVVQGLGGSAGVVGLLTVVTSITALPGQRLFGVLADRWGPHRVQLFTGLLIPILPAAWMLVRAPWHIIPINLTAGFLWAGYTLASFNLLLALSPEDQRPAYTALYQIVTLASLGAGALLGGWVVTRWGYLAVFALSAVGRLIAALMFARFVPQPAAPETA